MDRIALSMMIKGPLSLVALGVVVYLTASIVWGARPWPGFGDGSLSPTIFPMATRSSIRETGPCRPCWEMRTLARLAWLALPLGIVMMLISLNRQHPSLFH